MIKVAVRRRNKRRRRRRKIFSFVYATKGETN